MRKYPYMPSIFVTALLTAGLCCSLPAWSSPADAENVPDQVPEIGSSSEPSSASPPEASPAETEKSGPAEADPKMRTIQVQVPSDRAVTVRVLPNGDTIVGSGSAAEIEITTDYHKDWPSPQAPSFLSFPWPSIPDDFADRPFLGVIDLQPTSHGYPDTVKISDAQLTKDAKLVLQRSSVLSPRVVNKLNFAAQQQLLNTPELTLCSRFTPTFFTTKNILLLHAPKNDVYSATLINLANLRGRKYYAPHTRDAVQAHTYLIKQALLPGSQAQQNVIGDDAGKYYHCLGASDINAKHAKTIYDSPTQAEKASLKPCPQCFEIRPLRTGDYASSASAQQSPDFSETDAGTSAGSESEAPDGGAASAAPPSRSAQSRTTGPRNDAINSAGQESDHRDWEDSFLHRPYQSLNSKPNAGQKRSASRSVRPSKYKSFVTQAPLAGKHIQDRCFDETYRNLLRANEITDIKCAAFLISDRDCCAFPYFAKGPIYVTRGLYEKLDTPGELGAALSRELAKLLLGYVDDRNVRFYDDPSRPWLMTARTRRIIEDSRLLYNWYSTMELLNNCGSGPYWSYSPIPLLGYETISDHAYFALSDEQAQKVDKVAAVMNFVAGYDPSEFASYVNKINKMQRYCESPNGDINMWLLSSGTDKKRSAALQNVLQNLNSLNRDINSIAPSDPALARALRAQAAVFISDPQSINSFIQAYRSAIPAY